MNPAQLAAMTALLDAQGVPYEIRDGVLLVGVQPPPPKFDAVTFDPDMIKRANALLPAPRTDRAARRGRR